MNSRRVLAKPEYKVVFYVAYIIALILVFFSLLSRGLLVAMLGIIFVHLFFVFVVSLMSFGIQFFWNFFFPILSVMSLIDNLRVKRYLKKFVLNEPRNTVIILGHSNWLKFQAWIKPNFFLVEIKSMTEYLQKKNSEFSFYPGAVIKDVHKIMENREVKEVFFFGHGDSHTFQLGTDEILYYCDFNKEVHGKDFVHQVHCGDKHGKNLIDYVVPEENKIKCFFFDKTITGPKIIKEFKKRTREL
jgi:hypothetical protein